MNTDETKAETYAFVFINNVKILNHVPSGKFGRRLSQLNMKGLLYNMYNCHKLLHYFTFLSTKNNEIRHIRRTI